MNASQPPSTPDNRGVSDMMAILVMVGVAFLLAAGVGMNAFLFTDTNTGPPTAAFSYDHSDVGYFLHITCEESDDRIKAGDVYVDGPDNNVTWSSLSNVNESTTMEKDMDVVVSEKSSYGSSVTAGDEIEVVLVSNHTEEPRVLSSWSGRE